MKAYPLSVSCSCGNIECTNIELHSPRELHISSRAISKIKGHLHFSPLHPKSIIIGNQNLIQVSNPFRAVYEIKCKKCQESLYIFPNNSYFNVAFPKEMSLIKSETMFSEEDTPLPHIPIILRPFVFAKVAKSYMDEWDSDEIEPIDIDEEYMFSPTRGDCIIGSYEDKPMLFDDIE